MVEFQLDKGTAICTPTVVETLDWLCNICKCR